MKRKATILAGLGLTVILMVVCGGMYWHFGNRPPVSDHRIMLEASCMNWGLVDPSSDYWDSSNWTVYYDGTVEYFTCYNLSGESEPVSWQLSRKDMDWLYRALVWDFRRCPENYNAADGSGWRITWYDEQKNVVHVYNGYIFPEDASVLPEITALLTFDDQIFREDFVIQETGEGVENQR